MLEALLGSDELAACVRLALGFLDKQCGLGHAVVLAPRPGEPRSLLVAESHGLASTALDGFSVDLDAWEHPLVRVFSKNEPEAFAPGKARVPMRGPLWALPLGGQTSDRAEGHAVALMLVAGGGEIPADVRWVGDVLGEKLQRLQATTEAAERTFRRERALLYSVVNAVTDPILLTDTEGKLIIANARAERLFAAHEDESEGRRHAVGINNMLFSAALSSQLVDHAEGGGRNEVLLVDPSEGEDLLFELLATTVREPDGQTGVVSVLRNVTDVRRATLEVGESYRQLHQAQQEIRSERHRLDLVLDSVVDPIVVTDAAGDIVMMNPPAERLFTVPHEGSDESQRRVRANDAHFSSFVSNLLFSGDDMRWRGEISLIDPVDGSARPVEAVAGKILSDRGELTTVVTILHDRREALEKAALYDQVKRGSEELAVKVQQATAELAEQNELLRRQAIEVEQASAAKSQFLANVSHELRTPLNAILGYCNMLVQGVNGKMSQAQRRSLVRIDSNGRHLLEVINEILDITRIEAGRMPLHVSKVRVQELVDEVLAELEPIITRSRLPVLAELPPSLPVLDTDRQKVKQIVLNLLSNALKFTPQGSIRLTTRYNARLKELQISVQDTGIGIAPENQERVFEDFQQVDSSPTRPYGGTGLGLSICRRLADMLHGRITLESTLGVGSTFT
ncbi:MAG TPA: ATP-binding protein, partial [Myxococcales bacterium]|nr:ATP-binding protein [Myxococcales bacterium]